VAPAGLSSNVVYEPWIHLCFVNAKRQGWAVVDLVKDPFGARISGEIHYLNF
jgi:hypothetical protein